MPEECLQNSICSTLPYLWGSSHVSAGSLRRWSRRARGWGEEGQFVEAMEWLTERSDIKKTLKHTDEGGVPGTPRVYWSLPSQFFFQFFLFTLYITAGPIPKSRNLSSIRSTASNSSIFLNDNARVRQALTHVGSKPLVTSS